MRFVSLVVLALVLASGVGLIGYLLRRREPYQVNEQLDRVLAATDLRVEAKTLRGLRQRFSRRSRWGAVGAGIGFAVVFLANLQLSPGPSYGAMSAGGLAIGAGFGSGLSAARHSHAALETRIRVTSMQPHGMTDYLSLRQIVAELSFVMLGLLTLGCGVIMLVEPAGSRTTAWMLVAAGGAVSGVSLAALLMQRWLLNEPTPADGPAPLVTNDVVLATGLRDLLAAAGSAVMIAGFVVLLQLGVLWWEIGLCLIVSFALVRWALAPRLGPTSVPVAHRLVGRAVR